jgi:hypothetical protein
MVQVIYLLLCVVGLALPYGYLVPFLLNGGQISQMVDLLFVNSVSAAFGVDVLISFVVLCVFIWVEGARLKMRSRWLYILVTAFTGISFGLPLFLLMRQRQMDRDFSHET